MSFLQPALLVALPLMALPVIIHLIHQQRHRTIQWAAMMFLLDAKRMTRGMARLRHFLILALRMLAIAALILGISRPLASGWLGMAGGIPDTTIVVLDRSPSMEQQNLQTGQSKRSTGLRKLHDLIALHGGASHLVLIDSADNVPIELDTTTALLEHPNVAPSAVTGSLSAMLQTALDYVTANQTGRTDIWICSDLQQADWDPENGRWASLRAAFAELPGIRFELLVYPEVSSSNTAVEVRNVRRRDVEERAEVSLDLTVRRAEEVTTPVSLPLQVVVNGARSVLNIDLHEAETTLQGHVVPIDPQSEAGWGRIELPNDSNPQDNFWNFTFAREAARRTIIVSDEPLVVAPLQFALSASPEPDVACQVETVAPGLVEQSDWDDAGLLIWHAPLPDGPVARRLMSFLDSGRTVLFLPPGTPAKTELFGLRWGEWQVAADDSAFRVDSWRGDSGLLAHSQSGAALPVGELSIYRRCEIAAAATSSSEPVGGLRTGNVFARFEDGASLLTRAETDRGMAYFLATLPHAQASSFARDGVVFYVLLHRALATGTASQSRAQMLTAGTADVPDLTAAEAIAGSDDVLSSSRRVQPGIYDSAGRYLALNRSPQEDTAPPLASEAARELFTGLDYQLVEDRVDNALDLASEIWRTFLVAMTLALIAEAALCLPPAVRAEQAASL